jgi:putative aldouronate transport system permease protein
MRRKIDAFDIFNMVFLGLLGLIVILPFYHTVVLSLTTEKAYLENPNLLFPETVSLINYKYVFQYSTIFRSFFNSTVIVVAGVAYSMFLTITMAYAFSKKAFPGRNFFINLVIFTMFFNGGLIPFYLLIDSLELREKLLAVILPFGLSVFNMIVMRTFFEQLPKELEESASIDGAGPIRILVQIILPLVMPAVATLSLFYAVERWNEWFFASLFISKKELFPIQLILREILFSSTGSLNIPQEAGIRSFSEGIKATSVVIVIVPIMMVYPFLQRYFVKGIVVGAIKS